jgi:hypothetical protein
MQTRGDHAPAVHWGSILAGGVLASAIGWIGDLFGAAVGLGDPALAGGYALLGGLVTLAILLTGCWVGGRIAVRLSGLLGRRPAALAGALVWSIVVLTAALEYVLVGGTAAVSVDPAATATRVGLALSGVGLLLAGGAAVAGAIREAGAPVELRRRLRTLLEEEERRPAEPEDRAPPPH